MKKGDGSFVLKKHKEKEDTDKTEKEAAKDAVKEGVLRILKENYDFEEEDFISAELEVVPAGKAREAGFDRSIILGYGQDDRVCAFTSLKAILLPSVISPGFIGSLKSSLSFALLPGLVTFTMKLFIFIASSANVSKLSTLVKLF